MYHNVIYTAEISHFDHTVCTAFVKGDGLGSKGCKVRYVDVPPVTDRDGVL